MASALDHSVSLQPALAASLRRFQATQLSASCSRLVAPSKSWSSRAVQTRSRHVPRAVSAAKSSSEPVFKEVTSRPDYHHYSENLTVGDFMSTHLITAKPTTSIQEALEMLVEFRITGLPVVDDSGTLVGVVSDYDLLAIDALLGTTDPTPMGGSLFPKAEGSWKAFKELQKLLAKTKGKVVGDVMTPHPVTVRANTNMDEAARMLLGSQFRRLPVLNSEGKLVGLLTRGNVVKAALDMKRQGEDTNN